MALRTNYQSDKFQGKRKWEVISNNDGTVSLIDVTIYETEGDIFNADDINSTNSQINANTSELLKANTTIESNKAALTTTIESNKAALTTTIESNKAALTQLRTITLTVSGWSSSAPYTQTISIIGMTASDSPTVGILYPASLTETQKANIDKGSNMITKLETISGGLRVICQFRKPTVDIILGLKGV